MEILPVRWSNEDIKTRVPQVLGGRLIIPIGGSGMKFCRLDGLDKSRPIL